MKFLNLFEGITDENPSVPSDLHVNLWPVQTYLQDPEMHHIVKSHPGLTGVAGPVGNWAGSNQRWREYPKVDINKPLAFSPVLPPNRRGIQVTGMVHAGTPRDSVRVSGVDPAFAEWLNRFHDTGKGSNSFHVGNSISDLTKRLVPWLVAEWTKDRDVKAEGEPCTGFIVNI